MTELLEKLDQVINEEKNETIKNCLKLVKLNLITIKEAKEKTKNE